MLQEFEDRVRVALDAASNSLAGRVAELHLLEGWSYVAVARVLGRSIGTAATWVHHLRAELGNLKSRLA